MTTHDERSIAANERPRAAAPDALHLAALMLAAGLLLSAGSDASAQQDGAEPSDTPPAARAGDPNGAEPGLAANATPSARIARAVLEPTEGNNAAGRVEFVETPDGVAVEARISGLEPGSHGIHVHENGDCSAPDASSAGDHLAPLGSPHGAPDDPRSERHAGDLGNVTAASSGDASMRLTDHVLELNEDDSGVIGRAVIVHADEDDLTSQPSGNSGDPVACGVIELVESGKG